MKKNVFTFALALLTAGSAWALEFQSEDFSYKVINSSEKTVEITDYLGYSTELTIPHAVTYNDVTYSVVSIGSEAFKQSAFLMTVSIPNSIKTIGTSAFSGCSSLTAINIPNSVTSIQASTFSDCSSLASINIPTPVTSIGDKAFYGCYSMTEVTIGNRVTSIGASAFEGCFSLTQITIPNSVTSIGSSAFKGCDALTQVNISSGVTSIGESAFNGCSALMQVTIPDGVTSIESSTFKGCNALTQVNIGSGVTSIASNAFQECSAITQATWNAINCADFSSDYGYGPFYDSHSNIMVFTFGDQVERIPTYLCYGMDKLTQVTIPNNTTSIGEEAFFKCSALTQLTIGNSVTNIGGSAFYGCSALTRVNIGSGVTSIASNAFLDCSAITQVTWNAINCADFSSDYGYGLFYDSRSNITTFTFGDQMEHIPAYLCYGMDKLTQVTIPDGVTSIGNYAFYGCSKLTQVTIGSSMTSIGNYTFKSCSAIIHVTWKAINYEDFTSSDYSPFYDSRLNITTFTFGDQVEHIPAYLCNGMEKLTEVAIGNSVTSIGDKAFENCSAITQVTWKAINYKDFTSSDYSPFYDSRLNITTFTFGDQVEHIPAYLCDDMNKLTEITIPNSVTSIGKGTFYSCKALTQVTIPDGVTSIASNAFLDCSALTQVTIGDGVESIGSDAFRGCSALAQVTIGSSVTFIGYYAFYDCKALTEMTVLATVPPMVMKSLTGKDAFYNVSREIPVYVPAEALADYQAEMVWREFNLQAMPTALHTPSMPESIRVYGGTLHNPQQLPVSLYDMQGRMVYSGTAATVSQPAGVYVVRCAGASGKVLF